MFAAYVTHPQVVVDPAVPVPRWGLSALGRARTEAAARRPWVAALGRVVSSDELKAREAAAILARGAAGGAGVAVEVRPDLHENDRSATGYLPAGEFEAAADAFFAAPDKSFRGWETARAAQRRVLRAVDALLAGHPPAVPMAFVGHGAVGTLLALALARRPIDRDADQPPGGGNLFAFALADRRVLCGWTPVEAWNGPGDGPGDRSGGLAERTGND